MDDLTLIEEILDRTSRNPLGWERACDQAEDVFAQALEWLRDHPDVAEDKMLQGHEEHDEDPMEIKTNKEILDETIDLVWYTVFHKLKGFNSWLPPKQ